MARSGMHGVHIDGDVRRQIADVDEQMQTALCEGRPPDIVDNRAPRR
jgi:hypothetical protein